MARSYTPYRTKSASPLTIKTARLFCLIAAPLLTLLPVRNSAEAVQPVLTGSLDCFSAAPQLLGSAAGCGFKTVAVRTTNAVAWYDSRMQQLHLKKIAADELISADRYGYAVYTRTGSRITLYNSLGKKLAVRKTAAYPRKTGSAEYTFLIAGDQTGIALLRNNGHLSGRWHHFSSMITARDCNTRLKLAGIGLIDGSSELINLQTGKTVWHRPPGNSRINFIKGGSLNTRGEMLLLSGLQPERLLLVKPDGRPAWQLATGGRSAGEVDIFAGEQLSAAHDGQRGIVVRTDSGRVTALLPPVIAGSPPVSRADYSEAPRRNLLLISLNRGPATTLTLLDLNGRELFHETYRSRWAFPIFSADGRGFAVQTEDQLYIYRLFGTGEKHHG